MKLISFLKGNLSRVGVMHPVHETRFLELYKCSNIVDLLSPQELDRVRAELRQAVEGDSTAWQDINDVELQPIVPRPGKIICAGLNYADHAKEGGNERPEYPSFFLRGGTSLVAHCAPLILSRVSDKFDFEAELAVVIGKRIRHATAATALSSVAGYTCFNDGTFRDYQRRTAQWTIGKNFDGTGALGPFLVTPDEVPPGATGLDICSILNGQVMQRSNTRNMLWSVAELIEILSECLTLEPGDVIATGTPAGVGHARRPPVFMREGDTIEIAIESIGRLSNPVRREEPAGASANQPDEP